MLVIGVRAVPAPRARRVERQPVPQDPPAVREFQNRQQRRTAQARTVRRCQRANLDLLHLVVTLQHHFHVRLHHRIAQLAKLLHILLVNHFPILLLRDAKLLQQVAHRKERAQECVALHAQLQIAAVRRLLAMSKPGSVKTRMFLSMICLRAQRGNCSQACSPS